MSNVKYQLTYPHFSLGQVSGFIGQKLHFHNLTYEQFIAGELTTISNCEDQIEKEGRLELLQKISLWKLRANVAWSQVCSAYAHIIRKLENHEINWFADWDRYERHIYDKIATPATKNEKARKSTQGSASPPEVVWFCKQYQKAKGCNREAPHSAWVSNAM